MAIDQDRLRTAVIGCGSVGNRRAQQASIHSMSRLLLVIDTSQGHARSAADRFGAAWSTNWRIAIDDERIDAVIVSTPNAFLYDIASAALQSGKHVLMEKPMGCDLVQAQALAALARESRGLLKVGFNHRYHPGLRAAHERFTAGEIGEAISLRVRYGHGGRPGYENEWRSDPKLAGGGELTDQGVHVADLLHWFLGMPQEAFAYLQTAVWPVAPLEDNAFGLLRFENGCIASVHTSWTQWKNLFSFELFGKRGSLTVEGLGGSYGVERLTLATRNPLGGAPETVEESYDGPDQSWALEWNEFVEAMLHGTAYSGTPDDGVAAMRIVRSLYDAARDGVPAALV